MQSGTDSAREGARFSQRPQRDVGPAYDLLKLLLKEQLIGRSDPDQLRTFSEAVSLQINCGYQDEVDHYWSKLSEGGEEGPCGWLKDRYGLSWQVVPSVMYELLSDPDTARAQRAMQAMLGMKKLDVAALRAAADQA